MMDFTSILVKRILKTLLKFYDGFYVMIGFPYELPEGRAMRRKRRAETRLVNWITVTIVTYHYDYNIVPPQ